MVWSISNSHLLTSQLKSLAGKFNAEKSGAVRSWEAQNPGRHKVLWQGFAKLSNPTSWTGTENPSYAWKWKYSHSYFIARNAEVQRERRRSRRAQECARGAEQGRTGWEGPFLGVSQQSAFTHNMDKCVPEPFQWNARRKPFSGHSAPAPHIKFRDETSCRERQRVTHHSQNS